MFVRESIFGGQKKIMPNQIYESFLKVTLPGNFCGGRDLATRTCDEGLRESFILQYISF